MMARVANSEQPVAEFGKILVEEAIGKIVDVKVDTLGKLGESNEFVTGVVSDQVSGSIKESVHNLMENSSPKINLESSNED